MTAFETLHVDEDGPVVTVTIDHPRHELNAVDAALHHDLTRLFGWLGSHPTARSVLLTGRGRAFSAGGDFAWFPELSDPERLERLRVDAKRLVYDLLDVPVPIVAAVNGPAMGLGATIALLCDVVIMAETAAIGDPHVRAGLAAGDGGTIAWPLVLGPMLAKRYLLTGDPVPADEAVRLGLAVEAVPDADLAERATAWARRLAGGAPLAIRATKQAVNAWLRQAAATMFEQALASEIATFTSRDHREAVEAWHDKRRPEFEGR